MGTTGPDSPGTPTGTEEGAMDIASPTASTAAAPGFLGRIVLTASTVCALVVTVINVGVYGLGQMTDASFLISPPLVPQGLEVGAMKVAFTTLAYFAPGVALLVFAARRSLRSVRILTVVAAVFAVASAWGPLEFAHDRATGWVLAPMHLTTGAAFVLAAVWVHRRLAAAGY